MTYTEADAERDVALSAKFSRRSDGNLWVAGLYANRVVGHYQEHATKEIHLRSGKSISSVQNWAHAYEIYSALRKSQPSVNQLRKMLTPSHFWTAWEISNKYNLTEKQVYKLLIQMTYYKRDGKSFSVDALRQEADAEYQKGAGPSWVWFAPKLLNMVTSLLAMSSVPYAVKHWLEAAPPEVRKVAK